MILEIVYKKLKIINFDILFNFNMLLYINQIEEFKFN